ncbi:sensor histidine kinase [Chitinophaga lutea]
MNIPEHKLRIWGYLILNAFFIVFFLMEMYFYPKPIENLTVKILLVSIPFTAAAWEPTRFLLLRLRKRWPGIPHSWRRISLALLVLIPYGCLIGFLRVYLEDYTNLWNMKIDFLWYYTWTCGTVLLFIMLQIAVYESVYYFSEWKQAVTEAEELKRLHLETQFDALKVQIQPHFLFNTLNTLIGLMELDKDRARKFTEELAYVYRYVLEANESMLIGLEDELHFTRAYFFLLKNRYDEGLYLEVTGGENLRTCKVPPLSLQMLLENAVKHNIITKANPLRIRIHIDPKQAAITVANNLQRRRDVQSTGKGLRHLKEKMRLLALPDIAITQTATEFSVRLPLVKSLEYESIDH